MGLKIQSFVRGDHVVARFTPSPHHQAYPGMVNGGIIGTLLDCHMNWTAAWHLMNRQRAQAPPCTVTAEYKVEFKRPTPIDQQLLLDAWITDSSDRKAVVEATLGTADQVTAIGHGVFVAVKEGHPAFHRW
jgi:acyl-coenzyme A thioesterase PaaI-like protein